MGLEIFNGRDLRFYGDSITFGALASSPSKRWTTVFCTAVGAIEHNYGVSGSTMQNAAQNCGPVFNVSTITSKVPNDLLMFIALGSNDININNASMNPTGYEAALNAAIDNAISKGWQAKEIVLLDTYYMSRFDNWVNAACANAGAGGNLTRQMQYVQKVKDVASARGCVLADTQGAMDASSSKGTFLQPDGVHMTDIGNQFISDYLQTVNYSPVTVNVFANRPNVLVAKANKSFEEAGINADNMSIIYECGSSEAPKSWQPGRPINGITSFEINKGYYLMPLQDIALSDILMPPTPEDL